MKNSKAIATKNHFSVREIAFLSLTIAVCVVGRTAFQFIVNVQPVTDILLLLTIYRGIPQGLVVSLLSILITNFYMGMGVWTIGQLISYGLLIVLTGLLAKIPLFKQSLLLQIVYSFFAGMLFGFVISAIQAPFFGIQAFLPYYLAGLPTDILHGFGNVVFYIILGPILKKQFGRFDEGNKSADKI